MRSGHKLLVGLTALSLLLAAVLFSFGIWRGRLETGVAEKQVKWNELANDLRDMQEARKSLVIYQEIALELTQIAPGRPEVQALVNRYPPIGNRGNTPAPQ